MAFLAPILPVLSVVGTVVSTLQSFSSAKEEGSYVEQSAQVEAGNDFRNAEAEAKNAAAEEFASEREAEVLEDEQRRQIALQRARSGAAGVGSGVGSPLLAMWDSYYEGEKNRLYTLQAGDVRSSQLTDKAAGWYIAGNDALAAGAHGKAAANTRATGSLLSGAASVASKASRSFTINEPGKSVAQSSGYAPSPDPVYGGGYP